jgi:hypothetical protein
LKLIIAGSRDFQDYWALERAVLDFLKRHRKGKDPVQVISGCARGADKLGEKFAERFGLETVLKPADWKKHGKAAGMIRNKEMAQIASHAILFWDGVSRGTRGMLEIAEGMNLTTEVVRI